MTDLSHLRGLIERATEPKPSGGSMVALIEATQDWRMRTDWPREQICEALPALLDEIERLREAVEPLAREYDAYCEPDEWGDDDELADVPTEIKFGDLRRARLALTPNKEPDHG